MTDEQRRMADVQISSMRLERARILLDYYDALGQPAKAAGVEDQLAGVNPADERLKPEFYEVHAHAAAMENRRLDALLYYQAARQLGGRRSYGGVTDTAELDQKIAALYKDLGGTAETLALFHGKTPLSPLSAVSWETPKNPLPAFTLTDLGGKTWSLVEMKSVATLLNVWATWCGPCRAEHPELEKLYQKVKDRKDVAVLTVNVDEEAGLVAPYMTEHKYTFPVVLGKDLVSAVTGSDGFSIPQNWLIAPGGKLETIQSGYGSEPEWQNIILSKLQEIAGKSK
jgi:thiol-disulfide isomerase/thioredoxin